MIETQSAIDQFDIELNKSGKGLWCWQPNAKIEPEVCQKLIDCAEGHWNKAKLIGPDNDKIRKGDNFFDNQQWVYDLIFPHLYSASKDAGWYFDITGAENYQIAKYEVGDFYGVHSDSIGTQSTIWNTPENLILHGKTRKISMSLLLNDDFEGGELIIAEGKTPVFSTKPKVGTMLFFPSFIQHSVKPVTKGTRYSLVMWFIGPPFK